LRPPPQRREWICRPAFYQRAVNGTLSVCVDPPLASRFDFERSAQEDLLLRDVVRRLDVVVEGGPSLVFRRAVDFSTRSGERPTDRE